MEPSNYGQMEINHYADIIFQQTFSLMTSLSSVADTLDMVPIKFINISRVHFHGRAHCQPPRHSRSNMRTHFQEKKVSGLSTCPWSFVRNIDPNRKPEVLIEANCACQSPTHEQGQTCYPVTQYLMVYRRIYCELGIYHYERIWEPVVVACTAGLKQKSTILNGNSRIMRP